MAGKKFKLNANRYFLSTEFIIFILRTILYRHKQCLFNLL